MSWNATTLSILLLGIFGSASYAPLHSAPTPQVAEDDLLTVGVRVFDPGSPKKSRFLAGNERVNLGVRRSEAAFVAVSLMRTLQWTGSFGLVRMVPRESKTVDLMVTGRIHHSSGRRLVVDLEVADATGGRWLDRRYKSKADDLTYAAVFLNEREPFQDLYDRFAADLVQAQNRIGLEHLEELRRVAELSFAAQLAPGIFGDYLRVDRKGRLDLERLPSRDDPMLARVRKIQTRDEYFLDLLTERFEDFYLTMVEPYDEFRSASYEAEIALRNARAQANLANVRPLFGPRNDSPVHVRHRSKKEQYFRRQAAASARYLEDISQVFALEIDPLRIELDGEVIRFAGTIEEQYAQWQKLLEQIFETETGLSATRRLSQRDLSTRH